MNCTKNLGYKQGKRYSFSFVLHTFQIVNTKYFDYIKFAHIPPIYNDKNEEIVFYNIIMRAEV